MIKTQTNPIIMLGMHRSGTSVVTRILGSFGLYTGWLKDRNDESLFFLWINDWLMGKAGGSWSYPEPFIELLNHQELYKATVSYLYGFFRFPYFHAYLGPAMSLRYQSVSKISSPWGWKDPRNIYTLPLWLELFPNAKVVFIYRHGIDVANSLYTRQKKEIEMANDTSTILHRHGRLLRGHWLNTGVLSLESCFTLWEKYNQQALTYIRSIEDHVFSIKYENLLENPIKIISELAEFCELDIASSEIEKQAARLNADRRFAYLQNEALVEFAHEKSAKLAFLGY
jgi:hypothetical protein